MEKHIRHMVFNDQYSGSVIDISRNVETRCPTCGHLLFKGEVMSGSKIEIKCTGWCKSIHKFKYV